MSFDLIEASEFDGFPVEFYEFSLGDQAWRFSSAETTLTFQGAAYEPLEGLAREDFEQGQDPTDDVINITMPRVAPIARLFLTGVPPRNLILRIYGAHRTDLSDFEKIWDGRVAGYRFKDSVCTLQCDLFGGAYETEVARHAFQGQCNYVLGRDGCPVPLADLGVLGFATQISRTELQADSWIGLPSHYVAGHVESGLDRRMIIAVDSVAGKVTLDFPLTVNDGDAATAFPGCNRTDHCRNPYGIYTNDGAALAGFPSVASQNPRTSLRD